MVQRIGITGASGVGKSTLSIELSRRLGILLAAEGAREAANGINITSCVELCRENALEFQMKVLESKIHLEDQCGDSFVSDRTVVDCAAYWIYRELKGLLSPNPDLMQDYFNIIQSRLKNNGYGAIIFLEGGSIEWKDDGFRTYDETPISALILGLLYGEFRQSLFNYGTKIIFCPKDIVSISDRISFILEILKSKG